MNITYSAEFELYRTTEVATKRTLVESFTEPTNGTEEFTTIFNLAVGATDVAIPLGGLGVVKSLFINGKPNGGTVDASLMIEVIYEAAAGVPVPEQAIRFGSQLVILDSRITAITITNLGGSPIDIAVRAIGE